MNIDLSNILFESDGPESKDSNEENEGKEDGKVAEKHKDATNIEINMGISSVNRYKENQFEKASEFISPICSPRYSQTLPNSGKSMPRPLSPKHSRHLDFNCDKAGPASGALQNQANINLKLPNTGKQGTLADLIGD